LPPDWPQEYCHIADASVAADGSVFFLVQASTFSIWDTDEAQLGAPCPLTLRSYDSGNTFHRLPRTVWPVVVAPSNPRVLYGFCCGQLCRSDNGGHRWKQVGRKIQFPEAAQEAESVPAWCFSPPVGEVDRATFDSHRLDYGQYPDRQFRDLVPATICLASDARSHVLLVDASDPDCLYLGLGRLPKGRDSHRPHPADDATYCVGSTMIGVPAEWRKSEDGGRTWCRLVVNSWQPPIRGEWAEDLSYQLERAGGKPTLVPAQGQRTACGAIWPSPSRSGMLYWSWTSEKLGYSGPGSLGVLVSDDGRHWSQIGLVKGDPPEHIPLGCFRPGVGGDEDCLYAFGKREQRVPARRKLVFYRYWRGQWDQSVLFDLTDSALPEPRGLLVDRRTGWLYVPLARSGEGTIRYPNGTIVPTSFNGILVGRDGGCQWRLYDIPAHLRGGQFVGPDRNGVLYVRTTTGDTEVWRSHRLAGNHLADLVISLKILRIRPLPGQARKRVDCLLRLSNIGPVPAWNAELEFRSGPPGSGEILGQEDERRRNYGPLLPGEHRDILREGEDAITMPLDAEYLYAVADPGNELLEQSEQNNLACARVILALPWWQNAAARDQFAAIVRAGWSGENYYDTGPFLVLSGPFQGSQPPFPKPPDQISWLLFDKEQNQFRSDYFAQALRAAVASWFEQHRSEIAQELRSRIKKGERIDQLISEARERVKPYEIGDFPDWLLKDDLLRGVWNELRDHLLVESLYLHADVLQWELLRSATGMYSMGTAVLSAVKTIIDAITAGQDFQRMDAAIERWGDVHWRQRPLTLIGNLAVLEKEVHQLSLHRGGPHNDPLWTSIDSNTRAIRRFNRNDYVSGEDDGPKTLAEIERELLDDADQGGKWIPAYCAGLVSNSTNLAGGFCQRAEEAIKLFEKYPTTENYHLAAVLVFRVVDEVRGAYFWLLYVATQAQDERSQRVARTKMEELTQMEDEFLRDYLTIVVGVAESVSAVPIGLPPVSPSLLLGGFPIDQDNTRPIAAAQPPKEDAQCIVWSCDASDPDGDSLVFTIDRRTQNMFFDMETGEVAFRQRSANVPRSVRVDAYDGRGGMATMEYDR